MALDTHKILFIPSKKGNRHISNLNGDIRRHVSQCQRLKKLNEAKRSNDNLSPASVDPSDPYQCRWCQFNTLYKGNMKRHLVTCHQVSVNVLARVHFDVERLRKCSGRRPIWDELPIQPRRDGRDDGCAEEGAGGGCPFADDAEAAGPN
uniref:C2H2-type domain-containing protein n=1 Tax=Globodera pallida TaxID=36090 RepID=A0A183C7Q8_GLOPA